MQNKYSYPFVKLEIFCLEGSDDIFISLPVSEISRNEEPVFIDCLLSQGLTEQEAAKQLAHLKELVGKSDKILGSAVGVVRAEDQDAAFQRVLDFLAEEQESYH